MPLLFLTKCKLFPPTSLRLFEHSLDFRSGICHSSTIRCTATPPETATEDGTHAHLIETPIIPDSQAYFDQFSQFRQCEVVCELKSSNYWTVEKMRDSIMEQAFSKGPTLVIVNTKKLASKLACACRDLNTEADVFHLSTNMCPAHRKEIITNRIDKESLEKARRKGKAVVCISTGLIEAGVDVDFDVIIRSVAGLDSCTQAAGRCNRHGEAGMGYVYIVGISSELENVERLAEIRKMQESMAEVLNQSGRIRKYLIIVCRPRSQSGTIIRYT